MTRKARLAGPALALGALCLSAVAVDVLLDISLRLRWLPVSTRAAIHGHSEYVRRLDDWLFTREPNLDVSYDVDRERYGDIVAKGRVVPERDSGDGRERVDLKTDRFGFRNDVDRDRCDVVILGDSFSEGGNVSNPWPLVLDRQIPEAVCNLSIAGAGTLQQAEFLERYALPRSPSIVVLAFFEGNDLEDNEAYAAMRDRRAGEGRVRRWARGRPLPRLVRSAFRGRPAASPSVAVEPADVVSFAGFDLAFYDAYVDRLGRSREALGRDPVWGLTESLLDRIAGRVSAADARLVLVFLPTKAHVHLDALLQQGAIAASGAEELRTRAGALRELVREWAAARGVAFVDALPPLELLAARGGKPYLTYDTHLTDAGHRVIATAVAGSL